MSGVLVVKENVGRYGQSVVGVIDVDKPKKLSKAGEWLKVNPKGLGVTIHDMRAVMR